MWRRFLAALTAADRARAAEQARQNTAAFRARVEAMDDVAIRSECIRIQIATIHAERTAAAAERANHQPANPAAPETP